MSISLPFDLGEVDYPSPSSSSPAGSVLAGASAGATVGSIIPFLGTTVGGAVGAAIAFFRTLGTGTPRLGWEKSNVIARQVSGPVQKLLNDAKYFQDPVFRDTFRRNYLAYVSSTNPGEANRRSIYLNPDGGLDTPEIVWLAYIWSLEGVSSMPDDPWPIDKRLQQASNDVILKSITEYETAKGISSGLISSFTVNPDGSVTANKAGFDLISALLVAGVFVGLAATRKKRK